MLSIPITSFKDGADSEMTLQEGCGDCRRWLHEEAEGLSSESRQKFLRTLEEKHDRLCCTLLLELRDDGEIPVFWNTTLDRFWEFSR